MNESESEIESINTMFRVVHALVRMDGAGITDLANRLDLPKSTVHNHISTLQANEYVIKTDDQYHISTRFLALGNMRRSNMRLFEIAKPRIRDLAENTGEIAGLTVEEHGRGILLYLEKGENAIQYELYSGMATPLHSTATGKAILSQMSREHVDEIIERHGLEQVTPHTITNREELYDELERVREQGYAEHRSERMEGVRGIAVPVIDERHNILGSIGISGPMSRLDQWDIEGDLLSDIKSAANIVEVDLQYS